MPRSLSTNESRNKMTGRDPGLCSDFHFFFLRLSRYLCACASCLCIRLQVGEKCGALSVLAFSPRGAPCRRAPAPQPTKGRSGHRNNAQPFNVRVFSRNRCERMRMTSRVRRETSGHAHRITTRRAVGAIAATMTVGIDEEIGRRTIGVDRGSRIRVGSFVVMMRGGKVQSIAFNGTLRPDATRRAESTFTVLCFVLTRTFSLL